MTARGEDYSGSLEERDMDDTECKGPVPIDDKWDRLAGDPVFEAWLDHQAKLALAAIEAGDVYDWLPGDPPPKR